MKILEALCTGGIPQPDQRSRLMEREEGLLTSRGEELREVGGPGCGGQGLQEIGLPPPPLPPAKFGA